MKKPLISCIITGNDETLPLLIADLDQYLSRHKNITYEVIVVTQSENNKIREITARFTNFVKNLELVVREKNDSARSLLEVGSAQARGSWHLFIETQKQVPMLELNKIIAAVSSTQNQDLIISSRFVHGAYGIGGLTLFEEVSRSIQKIFDRKPQEKTPCFLAAHETAAQRLSQGAETLSKITQKAKEQKQSIQEVPVFWYGKRALQSFAI